MNASGRLNTCKSRGIGYEPSGSGASGMNLRVLMPATGARVRNA